MGEIRETDLFTSERDNYSNAIYRLEKEIASSQSELSKIRMKISDKESDIRNLDQIIQLNYNESNVIDNKLSSCCDKLLKYKKSMILFLIAFLVAESLTVAFNFGIISDCVSPQLVQLRSFSPAAKTVAAFTVSQEL